MLKIHNTHSENNPEKKSDEAFLASMFVRASMRLLYLCVFDDEFSLIT